MNKKLIFGVIAVIIGIAGFMLLTEPVPKTTANASNHTFGDGKLGITLVEYGDFQCSACASYYPAIKEVKEKYKDQITFQFINLPIVEIHKNALAGSKAAEAASLQGKFWEMHDKLYESQPSWAETNDPLTIFTGYARDIGIEDIDKFTADYKSQAVNDVINSDINKFSETGERKSTPTFFLDGKKIEPVNTLDSFSEFIDPLLAEKSGSSESTEQTPEDTAPEARPEEETPTAQ